MSIKFRKQSAAAVPTPEGAYVQLFVDVDGQPKVKDNAGQVTPLAQASTLTLAEQAAAPAAEPEKLKLYAGDDAGDTELFIKDSNGNEIQVTQDGAILGTSGGLIPHPGLSGNPGLGEFSISDGGLVTLPSGATSGKRAGVFALAATDVKAPNGQQLRWGTAVVIGPTPITLKAGAYAEWVFCELEPGVFGWLPSGASNEEPPGPPLAHRPSGPAPVLPNEWVLSSEHGNAVVMPVAPSHGDSFGVLVDNADVGCALTPATGATLYNAVGNNLVVGPVHLDVPGPSYYEWIWNDNAGEWYPRQQIFSVRPAAVLNAIVSAPLDTISFGNKWLGGVTSPISSDQAATKGYVDAAIPYSSRILLESSVVVPPGGSVNAFSFPIPQPLTYYAFEFYLTIHQNNVAGYVSVGINGDPFDFKVNIASVRITATGVPATYAVTYGTFSNVGNSVTDPAPRLEGYSQATVTGAYKSSNASSPAPLRLFVSSSAGQTTVAATSWGRIWKA